MSTTIAEPEEQQPVIELIPELITLFIFQPCKKDKTRARVLTRADYEAMDGIIQTREGSKKFYPEGDFLGEDVIDGVLNHWPIRGRNLLDPTKYRKISEEDIRGYADYEPIEYREACSPGFRFRVNGLVGEAEDYLLHNGHGGYWPVAKAIWDQSYRWL